MNLRAIGLIAKSVIVEAVRRREIYVIVLVSCALIGLTMTLDFFELEGLQKFYREAALKTMGLATALAAIVLAARQLPREFENRTIYPLLARPVGRGAFLLGKLLGVFLSAAFCYALFMAVFVACSLRLGGDLPCALFAQHIYLQLNMILVISTLCFLLSMLMNLDAAITIGVLFLLISSTYTTMLSTLYGYATDFGRQALVVLNYAIPQIALFDASEKAVHAGFWEPLSLGTLAALTAYGYRGQWHHDAGADIGPSLEIVRREIGAGRAVIAPGIHPSPDGVHSLCNYWFVVTGVDVDAGRVQLVGAADAGAFALARGDDGRAEYHPRWYGICRTFDGMAGHYGPAGADNPLLTVEPSGVTPVPNTTVREALTRAVALAHEEEATASTGWGDGVYLSGIGAMEQLRNDVLAAQGDGPDEFNRLNPPKGDPFRGLGDELEHLHLLAQRRHAAAAFCRRAAGLLPDAASLADAADAYEQVADGAEQAFALRYGSTEQLTAVFALIDTVEDLDGDPRWSAYWQRADAALADPHVRERIGGHLTHVIEHEHSAITQIEAALTTRQ